MSQLTAGFDLGANGTDIQTADPGNANAWDVITRSRAATAKYDSTHIVSGGLAARLNSGAGGSHSGRAWTTALGSLTSHGWGRSYLGLVSLVLALLRDGSRSLAAFH